MYQPIEPFAWGGRSYSPTMVVDADDPAVVKFPHLFKSGTVEPPVERATARPGEKRSARRPKAES